MTGIPIKIGNRTIVGKIRLFDKTEGEYITSDYGPAIITCQKDGEIECFYHWREHEDGIPLNSDNLEIHIEPME